VSGLCLSKMSAPLFLPMALILAVIAIFSKESLTIELGRWRSVAASKTAKAGTIAAALFLIGATTVFAIWAAFGFRFAATTETGTPREVLDWRWNYLLEGQSNAERIIGFTRTHHLLPEAYLYGLVYIEQTSSGRPAFLDGRYSETGFASYFPRTFLYKTPLPVLLLFAIALTAAMTRWRREKGSFKGDAIRFAPIWTLLLVYGGFALHANLNIGHRYILPLYPALFVLAGGVGVVARDRTSRFVRPLLAGLIAWHVAESMLVRPDYLAYFNQIAGGPANGYKHLVDSSLDWGQDLPALKERLEQTGAEHTYLAYFGSAEPSWYGIKAIPLPLPADQPSRLAPGIYCISATILQHVYEPEPGPWRPEYETKYQAAKKWAERTPAGPSELDGPRTEVFHRLQFARLCAHLREKQPVARAGYSILVFRVTEMDLRLALDGPAPW
jgi:hypothetical protein